MDEITKIVDLFPVEGSPFDFLRNATAEEVSSQPLMSRTSGIDSQALSNALGYLNKRGLSTIASLRAKRVSNSHAGVTFELNSIEPDRLSKQYYSVAVGPGAEHVRNASQYNSIVYAVAKTLYVLVRPENNNSFAISGDAVFPPDEIPQMWVNIARNILRFEDQLAKAGPGWRTVSLKQLSDMSRHINWSLVLRSVLPDDVGTPSEVVLNGTIFDKFDSILEGIKKYGPLPLQIQGYLVWTAVRQLIRLIDPKYGQFLRPINDNEAERSTYCAGIVSSSMGKMVGPFFSQKVYNEHMTAIDMVDSIRDQLAEAYGRAVGINNSTKAREIQKLEESLSFAGFEMTTEDSAALEEFYKSLSIARNDFFGNRMRFAAWHTENSLSGLEGFIVEDQPELLPQDVNIRYDDINGYKIRIPVGSFRPFLFHDEYPSYVNYGGLGAMIAQTYAVSDCALGITRQVEILHLCSSLTSANALN